MLQIDPVPALLKRLQQTEMAEAERRANLVFQKGLSKDDSIQLHDVLKYHFTYTCTHLGLATLQFLKQILIVYGYN